MTVQRAKTTAASGAKKKAAKKPAAAKKKPAAAKKKPAAAKKKPAAAKKKPAEKAPAKKAAAPQPSKALMTVLGRALADKDYRELLFRDRGAALTGYRIAKADHEALDRLTKQELAEQAERVGARAGLTIAIKISKSF